MAIHESAENYLETILMLKKRNGKVRSVDIVNDMSFSKPSVSVAMKKLRESNHIVVDKDGYIELTESGAEIANRIYKRHEVLSTMLIRLGVSEHVAYEDACKIEHDLSDESFDCLCAHLEHSKE